MQKDEIIPHLFRTEYGKITAVLCRLFGFEHIEIAEDIVSDTFLTASETWAIKGLPDKPLAWLYTVAKNKARNHLKHNKVFDTKVTSALSEAYSDATEFEIDLSKQNISDSQLQMLFAVCHPVISSEAQISLALRILCGFGINEIADAFLINKETVTKRIYRAKETLRKEKVKIEFPGPDEVSKRLEMVLTTLYLLFNEGYYSINNQSALRKDLCLEAMRLTHQLTETPSTNLPQVYALLALMSFHASRFEARISPDGELILYDDQDETLWDTDLIAQGKFFFGKATAGDRLSKYHLEAGIAWWHTTKADNAEKWENILMLYTELLFLSYSPMAALNRTYALYKCRGKQAAIAEAEKLKLTNNHLYYALLGELYTGVDNEKARENFNSALSISRTQVDKLALQKKITFLN